MGSNQKEYYMSGVKTDIRFGMVYFAHFKNEDIIWGLLILGREAEIIDTDISIESTDDTDVEDLYNKLVEKKIDVALSFNFSPALSDACMKMGIIYVAWTYDAPIQMLFEKQVANNCNYIFSFDKKQIEQTKSLFDCNIFYLPLGSNITRNTSIEITERDRQRFSCDVSFIGRLYSESDYENTISWLGHDTRAELERLYKDVYGIWDGTERLYHRLSEDAKAEIYSIHGNMTGMDLDTLYTTALLVRKLAHRERLEMLTRLSKYNLYFFTYGTDIVIPGVVVKPPVNYLEELPNAYRFSKINMNITMRGITSGIPLRVFDIMGVGGFALTNYQLEVDELFSPGKDIEVYHDFDEMEEKVRFYLQHEDSRIKVAEAGAKTVREKYSIEKQVQKMLDVIAV